MVDVEVEYKSGKSYTVSCHRYDRNSDKDYVLIYNDKNEVVSKLTKSRIAKLGGKPL